MRYRVAGFHPFTALPAPAALRETRLGIPAAGRLVPHLQGGILNDLEAIPAEQSRRQGECFVLDARETLSHADFDTN
jgi:hypothetical protein